ncbi:hypothetical protein [Thermococcus eurythermalis]|nr:hypothetical protein [Thermococcus eurythermalis]
MVGVTAGSTNAQVFRPTISETLSVSGVVFASVSALSTQIPCPTKTVSPQDRAYYMNWISTHTFKAKVYERKIPIGDTIYITRTIIIPRLNIKLTMTSTENIRKFINAPSMDNTRSLLIIDRITYYETNVIVTRNDDPFKWWAVSPYLPRWTWERSGDYYVAVDPINLVWGAPKSMVKDTLSEHSWHDYTSYGGRQYIYIPSRGWVEADDMFKGFYFGTQRHVRLWQLPNGITVGSVHLEHWSWTKFDHVVDSYEKPEVEMLSTFSSWNKEYDYYNLNNPKKDGDGKATYIWKT